MDAGSGSRDGGVGVICCRIDDTSLGNVCTVSDVTVMGIKEHVTCHQMQCDSGVIAVVLRASPIALVEYERLSESAIINIPRKSCITQDVIYQDASQVLDVWIQ